MSQPQRPRKLLMAMTIRVGRGRRAPSPAKRLAKVGTTFHMMMATTRIATVTTTTG